MAIARHRCILSLDGMRSNVTLAAKYETILFVENEKSDD
jgi:hypothetical protein